MSRTYTRREIISVVNGATHKPHNNLRDVIGFRVLKIVCNNSFYNVIYEVNDMFEWLDNAGNPRSVTLLPGRYDYSSFATALQTACNAVGAETFIITYNNDTKVYDITTNLSITPQWVSGTNTLRNISKIAGFYNDTVGNETFSTGHSSNYPAQLIPSHYLFRSNALASGRKSWQGGGGGTQITTKQITTSPQNYINVIPNQVDGSLATFVYRAPDNDTESFTYNGPRLMSEIDLAIVHPYYPDMHPQLFYNIYQEITYEIEFLCCSYI